ncbi:MAG TPA: hypothetical protein VHP83_08245 [Aggregatilineaceae bacterium]|nr:hypothetical protein [Aggregatilineaceae bacterium]
MRKLGIVLLVGLVLVMAACGDKDEDKDKNNKDAKTPAATVGDGGENGDNSTNSGEFDPAAPSLNVQSGTLLPGCNDPDATECPQPLNLPLDSSVNVDGVQVSYPGQYFVASGEMPPVELTVAENYPFDERATFEISFVEAMDDGLAELNELEGELESADWNTAQGLIGKIGVVKLAELDPPVNTTVGVFLLPDGRYFKLRLETTGKYGWDLYSVTFQRMLDTLVFEK